MGDKVWSLDDLGDEGETAFSPKEEKQGVSLSADGVLSFGDIGAFVYRHWCGLENSMQRKLVDTLNLLFA